MGTILRILKLILFAAFALAVGFIQLSFSFSDLGRGESMESRLITAGILSIVSGLVIGYFNPRVWLLAGLTAWATGPLSILVVLSVISSTIRGLNARAFGLSSVLLLMHPWIELLSSYFAAQVREHQLVRRLASRFGGQRQGASNSPPSEPSL